MDPEVLNLDTQLYKPGDFGRVQASVNENGINIRANSVSPAPTHNLALPAKILRFNTCAMDPLLQLDNLSKRFGGLVAAGSG
jgi:hypothetical protein